MWVPLHFFFSCYNFHGYDMEYDSRHSQMLHHAFDRQTL